VLSPYLQESAAGASPEPPVWTKNAEEVTGGWRKLPSKELHNL
jgi:hypothetical protein